MNKTLRYFNSLESGNNSVPTQREQSTISLDLELLTGWMSVRLECDELLQW